MNESLLEQLAGPPVWLLRIDADASELLRLGLAHVACVRGEHWTLALTIEGVALLASRE